MPQIGESASLLTSGTSKGRPVPLARDGTPTPHAVTLGNCPRRFLASQVHVEPGPNKVFAQVQAKLNAFPQAAVEPGNNSLRSGAPRAITPRHLPVASVEHGPCISPLARQAKRSPAHHHADDDATAVTANIREGRPAIYWIKEGKETLKQVCLQYEG
ncbi:hypothetical protein Tcan_10943 [Toxocara canis]|uniref:Uncharacterized protein n=1 Tax=Toxocara canis TaxID=6265 RepID=A0A0B2V1B1_TOXCA|nr:hypothetical protein Tcan_10943 [Toxocara canis]